MPRTPTAHADLTTTDVHTIVRWDHADSTERLAEAIVAEDVGKVSNQLVDDTYWVLVDTVPTWKQLA